MAADPSKFKLWSPEGTNPFTIISLTHSEILKMVQTAPTMNEKEIIESFLPDSDRSADTYGTVQSLFWSYFIYFQKDHDNKTILGHLKVETYRDSKHYASYDQTNDTLTLTIAQGQCDFFRGVIFTKDRPEYIELTTENQIDFIKIPLDGNDFLPDELVWYVCGCPWNGIQIRFKGNGDGVKLVLGYMDRPVRRIFEHGELYLPLTVKFFHGKLSYSIVYEIGSFHFKKDQQEGNVCAAA